jgi:superfamily II DNA helicase RecQ
MAEKLDQKLRSMLHSSSRLVTWYHAGMAPGERADVQHDWSADVVPIVCATVAFGMGINKPDVRWVVHASLPKSLEGYAQESGRAGRDGLESDIVLFYTYADKAKMEFLLHKNSEEGRTKSAATLQMETDNLLRMVAFCENDVDCRRKMLLSHFDEAFDPQMCNGSCDNCCGKGGSGTIVDQDNTELAIKLCKLVHNMGHGYTMLYINDVFRGSNQKMIRERGHNSLDGWGAGKELMKSEVSRLVFKLLELRILAETHQTGMMGEIQTHLITGNNSHEFMHQQATSSSQRIILRVRSKGGGKQKGTSKKRANQDAHGRQPLSTKRHPGSTAHGDRNVRRGVNAVQSKGRKAGGVAAALPLGSTSGSDVNRSGGHQSTVAKATDSDDVLYSALVQFRKAESDRASCLPFQILKNDTLQQLVNLKPKTLEDLSNVAGISANQQRMFGSRLLDKIKEVVEDQYTDEGAVAGVQAMQTSDTVDLTDESQFLSPHFDGGARSSAGSSIPDDAAPWSQSLHDDDSY